MFDEALVDTDVLLKAVSYRLAHAALTYLADRGVQPKVLGAARFMLSSHVAKARRIADASAAAAELARAEPLLVDVEPSADETRLAAEIETLAVECGLQIDSGESQLLAMLIMGRTRLMITGDKRAVRAIGSMLSPLPPQRIACLEQLLCALIEILGADQVRSAICAEPAVDRALTAASSCSAPGPVDLNVGLASYIEDLRKDVAALICAGHILPS